MKKLAFLFLWTITFQPLTAQSNISLSSAVMEEVLMGNYDPQDYAPNEIIHDPKIITDSLRNHISSDSLKSFLLGLASFENRNTGSDTISQTRGIGAARRWVKEKFDQFDSKSGDRLLTGYLDFDIAICGMTHHRNTLAILPGLNNTNHEIIIIEGHMDSRCEDNCDVDCIAQGVEDNASGTALVMELARVLSNFSFDKTIVFMCTTGEEQGLIGAEAMTLYARARNLPIKAVLNNDVIGGIICGATSSVPSCPGENEIDSTHLRIFSSGSSSVHKQMARYVKLQYRELLQEDVDVPMQLSVMSAEDRTGRGGDHIPFRQAGYTAIRFTSANEHGNANPTNDYMDRQHSHRDISGIDLDGDGMIDSFFVDFNYLARNTVINAMAISAISMAPETPSFEVFRNGGSDILVFINDPYDYGNYRITVRQSGTDWDTIIATTDTMLHIPFETPGIRFVSVASVDSFGTESCFGEEVFARTTGTSDLPGLPSKITLLQNRPNPFDEATYISVILEEQIDYKEALLRIFDHTGREVHQTKMDLNHGLNEYLFRHGFNRQGTYYYGLWIDGIKVDVKAMMFAY